MDIFPWWPILIRIGGNFTTAVTRLMPIAIRLREEREKQQLTMEALARKAGVSISIVSKIEYGLTTDPRWSTMLKLAKALALSLDSLKDPD